MDRDEMDVEVEVEMGPEVAPGSEVAHHELLERLLLWLGSGSGLIVGLEGSGPGQGEGQG